MVIVRGISCLFAPPPPNGLAAHKGGGGGGLRIYLTLKANGDNIIQVKDRVNYQVPDPV